MRLSIVILVAFAALMDSTSLRAKTNKVAEMAKLRDFLFSDETAQNFIKGVKACKNHMVDGDDSLEAFEGLRWSRLTVDDLGTFFKGGEVVITVLPNERICGVESAAVSTALSLQLPPGGLFSKLEGSIFGAEWSKIENSSIGCSTFETRNSILSVGPYGMILAGSPYADDCQSGMGSAFLFKRK